MIYSQKQRLYSKHYKSQFLQSNLPLSIVTGAQIKPLRPPPTVKTP